MILCRRKQEIIQQQLQEEQLLQQQERLQQQQQQKQTPEQQVTDFDRSSNKSAPKLSTQITVTVVVQLKLP